MWRFSVFILLAAALMLGSGCGIIKIPADSRIAFKRQDLIEEQLNQLVSARSLEQMDKEFAEILDGKHAQKTVERLLSGWGKHDSWYNLAVVHFIWEHWPSYYGKWKSLDPGPLMSVIAARIGEQPSLLPEMFWYMQWRSNGLSFKWMCRACEGPGPCCTVGGDEFPLILLVASAIRDSQLVDFDPPASTSKAWGAARLYFLSLRPFLRFDAERVAYVTDYAAQREGRYLTSDEQVPVPPSTPLPEWDSDVVPSRPVKK